MEKKTNYFLAFNGIAGQANNFDAYTREELISTIEQYSIIVEYSMDSLFLTDGSGNVLWCNAAYEKISGMSLQELFGKNTRELAESGIFPVSCSQLVIQRKESVTIEQDMKNTGKRTLVTCVPIMDKDGTVIFTVSNNRDMTEITQLKENLGEKEAQLSKQQRNLEEIKQLLSTKARLVANDTRMLQMIYRAKKVAATDATILILGETGVGKGELTKYIHENSPRRESVFLKINCGAVSPNLIESELFGYEKGAFTGAQKGGKIGYFEFADKGTLFLDEIGELPMEMQVKLLQVLQESEVLRIGGTVPIKVDVRIIAATNRDLAQMVKNGTFRQDLYYRLNVAELHIPPLRERTGDILPLAGEFLKEFCSKYNTTKRLSPSGEDALLKYDWPGNARELKNAMEQAVIFSETELIGRSDFPFVSHSDLTDADCINSMGQYDLQRILEHTEKWYILDAYAKYGTIRSAAESLGMNMTTYARRLRHYGTQTEHN